MQVPAAGMESTSPEDPYSREQQSQMLPVTPAASKLTIPASRPLPPITAEAHRVQTVGQFTTSESLETPEQERQHPQACSGVDNTVRLQAEPKHYAVKFMDWNSSEKETTILKEKALTFELAQYVHTPLLLGSFLSVHLCIFRWNSQSLACY